MSSVDEGGVADESEADVVVMSEDGEADDGVLRALRDEQAKLDDAWKKKEARCSEDIPSLSA